MEISSITDIYIFQVELVGLAGVQDDEEFEFEVALPEDDKLKR